MSKKAIELKGLSKSKREFLKKTEGSADGRGIYCGALVEAVPNFIKAGCETVHEGKNNSYIVLGRDRPGTRLSGYGGTGDTQAGMIDIVVGRMGPKVREETENGEKIYVDPNLRLDSARIYLSQKTDVDDNFRLADGVIGKSTGRSAIAMKADDIRIISREGMKLITGTDPVNSQGGAVKSVGGIDLIAGNNDKDLQPLVKGKNLNNFLLELIKRISLLDGTLVNFVNYQLQFNVATLSHYHYSPFFGIPTSPDLDILPQIGLPQQIKIATKTIPALVTHKVNLKALGHNYLKLTGNKYINSRHNNTN